MKHKTYSKLSVIAATLLLTAPAATVSAQNNQNLTLNEAVQASLQNSKQLKLSKAKVDEAVANYKETWDNKLPDFKVSGSFMMLTSPTISGDLTKSSKGGFPTVNKVSYAMANASLPLFSGLRLKYGVESAKYLETAAKLNAQNTINAYSNLYKAMKTVELLKENLKQQDQRVTDFTNLESNGLIARNDLLKAQLQKSNVELSLLEAESNYKIACINMDLMLGLNEETMIIPDSTGFMSQDDAGTLTQWESTAMQNRKDFAALGYNEKAANAGIKATKGEYYPGVALTGGYIALDVPPILSVYNAFNIGVGVQYSISSLWKTGAKLDVAKARLHQVQATESIVSDQMHLQVSQAYQNYLLSNKKIDVFNKAIEQANENYRITQNKYTNNLVTTTDLRDADVAQLQAKLNYSFAKVDAVVAFKKLQQAAGILLNNYQTTNK